MDLKEELSKGLSKKEIKGLLKDYYVNRFDTEHLLLRYQVPLPDIQKHVLEGATETYYGGFEDIREGGVEVASIDFDESILLFVAKVISLVDPASREDIWVDKEEERLFDKFWGSQDFRSNFLDRAEDLENTKEWKQFKSAIAKIAKKANGDPSVLEPYFICKNVAFLYAKLFLFSKRLEKAKGEAFLQDDLERAEGNLKRIFGEYCSEVYHNDYNPTLFKRFMKEMISLKSSEEVPWQFSPGFKESLLYRAVMGAPKSPELNKFRIRLLTVMLKNAGFSMEGQELTKRVETSLEERLKEWLRAQQKDGQWVAPATEDPLVEYLYFADFAKASPLLTREEILNIDEEYEKAIEPKITFAQTKEEAREKIIDLTSEDFDLYKYTLEELNAIYQSLLEEIEG